MTEDRLADVPVMSATRSNRQTFQSESSTR